MHFYFILFYSILFSWSIEIHYLCVNTIWTNMRFGDFYSPLMVAPKTKLSQLITVSFSNLQVVVKIPLL
jgi:hypothetical protein